jgi:ATP-dependent protease ClpP protease subunit
MIDELEPPTFSISHVIIYSGPTNAPQSQGLRSQLAFVNQPAQPQAGITHLPTTGLLIVLSSWGGNTFEARSLYGLLRALSYPFTIHVTGVVQSAAVPLMLAADYRTAAPGTSFLFHGWTWGVKEHPGHNPDGLQQLSLLLDDEIKWARKVFDERSNLKDADIDRLQLFTNSRIEGTDFALQYGLIHAVTEHKIPPNVMTWNIAG